VHINNYLGSPSLSRGFVFIGVNDDASMCPQNAPQRGEECNLDTVGDRAMNAVWVDDARWTTFANYCLLGEARHVPKSRVLVLRLIEFANGGGHLGKDIADDTYSFFLSIAVVSRNIVIIWFSVCYSSRQCQ
jgi:hypothetical protein